MAKLNVSTRGRPRKAAATRDAGATRARFVEAAKILFSQRGYDGVGVRDIAADAGADPALLIRYFGSKEGLFRTVAAQAFGTEDLPDHGAGALAEHAVRHLSHAVDDRTFREGYDPFRLLLSSIGSATAGPIIAEYLDKDFIAPLAASLEGESVRERALMLAAHIVGFALLRVALPSPRRDVLQRAKLQELLTNALKACIAPDP